MTLIQQSVAAASAPVGTDLLANNIYNLSPKPRRLNRIGFAGSAAAGDTVADVFVGNIKYGQVINGDTGFPQSDSDFYPISAPIPPGEPLRVIITDAPATNPIYVVADVSP